MITVGSVGYAAVGIFYALLTVLLLVTWQRSRAGLLLTISTTLSTIWGFALAEQTAFGTGTTFVVILLDVLRTTIWVVLLAHLAMQIGVSRLLGYVSQLACAVVVAGLCVLGARGSFNLERIVELSTVYTLGGLVSTLFGLVLIEQLYRNASIESKWSLKPLVLGVGGLLAFDLFLYSQAILLGAIDLTTWLARGVVNAFFVPLVAIAARRNTDWNLRIFVSRQVVFYTTTLIAAGLYLLLMSFGGYLIVRYGGSWGALAKIVFLAGAGVVLLTLLFSSSLRSRLKVFLNKHFFHNKYDYRREWMRLVETLGEYEAVAHNDVAVKAIAQIVESPAGAIWIRDDANSVLKYTACYETDDAFPDFKSSEPIVEFIEEEKWLIDFAEYDRRPERYRGLQLPNWLVNRDAAWLLIPLSTGAELLGLILLYRSAGPPKLNYEDRDLLKTVGNHIAVHLAQARADSLLAEAQQFEAYNRLAAFLMHDLNNLIAQQSLIVENAEKHKRNPEFIDDAIGTIAGSVDRMKRVMHTLKSGGSQSSSKLVQLKFIVSAAVDRCSATSPVPDLQLNDVEISVAVNSEELTMVLAHLIRNAQDACAGNGRVGVTLETAGSGATISIADNGEGMSPEFVRDRLFRPFDSTKGAQGMGIGAYQAREYARKIGGDLQARSVEGEGTTMILALPVGSSSPLSQSKT